jgi:hypothetical protein
MNALVLHSQRGLSRPRTQIARRAPAESITVAPLLTAVARTFGAVRALAVRAHEVAAAQERKSRWVSSRQIESPELPAQFDIPERRSEPTTFKVRRSGLLDIFD